jgi:hypothetical protein
MTTAEVENTLNRSITAYDNWCSIYIFGNTWFTRTKDLGNIMSRPFREGELGVAERSNWPVVSASKRHHGKLFMNELKLPRIIN